MMRLGTIFLVLLIVVVAREAMAAGGGEGVPFAVVYQFINFFAFVALLTFLLRKGVRSFFASRVADFREQFERAKRLKEEAEKKNADIKAKIRSISETEDAQIKKAEADANALKAQMLSDSQAQSEQIKADAQKMAEVEYFKANQELRNELIDKVLSDSREKMNSDINQNDQSTLRGKFLDNVQAVQ